MLTKILCWVLVLESHFNGQLMPKLNKAKVLNWSFFLYEKIFNALHLFLRFELMAQNQNPYIKWLNLGRFLTFANILKFEEHLNLSQLLLILI